MENNDEEDKIEVQEENNMEQNNEIEQQNLRGSTETA